MRGRIIGVVFIGIVVMGGILAACAPSDDLAVLTAAPVDETVMPTLAPVEEVEPLTIRDLAERLRVPEDQIVVVKRLKAELPVGDLDCLQEKLESDKTQPGVVMGWELVLKAGDKQYRYYNYGKRLAYCGELDATEEQPEGAPGKSEEQAIMENLDAQGQKMVGQAREELADTLGVSPEKIHLVEAEAVRWSDSSLGCPEPGKMYAQVITPGYRIVLEYGSKKYEYHASQQGHMTLCEAAQSK